MNLADVLVTNLPCVHAWVRQWPWSRSKGRPHAVAHGPSMRTRTETMHPAVLPLALELVATGKAVGAAAALEPILPIALIARAIRVDAHSDTVDLAVLDVPRVLTLHCRGARRTYSYGHTRPQDARGAERMPVSQWVKAAASHRAVAVQMVNPDPEQPRARRLAWCHGLCCASGRCLPGWQKE